VRLYLVTIEEVPGGVRTLLQRGENRQWYTLQGRVVPTYLQDYLGPTRTRRLESLLDQHFREHHIRFPQMLG